MKYKRIVVKVGTNTICGEDGAPSREKIARIGSQIATLMKKGVEVILVSSGSIGAGAQLLLNGAKPDTLALKQACAAVGQPILISIYRDFFRFYGIRSAQVLMTGDVIGNRERFLNARNTFFTLLQNGVVPIVNENDTVSVEEIRFGDNDNLSVNVAGLVEADACFILSDIEGLYRNFGSENAQLIHQVEIIDEEIEKLVTGTKSLHSTGGMESKLSAARKSAQMGIPLVILPGYREKVLEEYLAGKKKIGTTFFHRTPLKSRKKWLFLNNQEAGTVSIDAGARGALLKGKSLLPIGIQEVEGDFSRGDLIGVVFENENLGKGITNYSSRELLKIKGLNSDKITETIGFSSGNEAIHRNNLILTRYSLDNER
jgi:glutamate 5-kinase